MLRMSSYMSRGQKLIEAGKTPDAMRLVTRGFQPLRRKSSESDTALCESRRLYAGVDS